MKTKMKAGRCVATYVDDAMGRRLTLTEVGPSGLLGMLVAQGESIVFATNQREAQEAIKTLRELTQELPP